MSGLSPDLDSREWLRVTLSSIGDAVITTDREGRCTFLNPVAEKLTGWTSEEAVGVELTQVFRIVNQESREEVENPALRSLREGVVVGLANHTLLIARDGTERPIDDSAAPIRKGDGEIAGSVLVFRDITERYEQEALLKATLDYTVNILDTQRQPFLVLDDQLRVVTGNRAFYQTFGIAKQETEGRFVYEVGDRQWNDPRLRELLEDFLLHDSAFEDFEDTQRFESVGEKVMLLNARRIRKPGDHAELILLAIEDISERRRLEGELRDSEMRYRRLFETAKDGVIILDGITGLIIDSNVFIQGLVGLERDELLGKELHDIGLFMDTTASKAAFRTLQQEKYLRYENLPIQNQRGEEVEVEVIANMYHEDHRLVAQCNVRDITERVKMQKRIAEQAEQLATESRRKDEFLAMLSHELRNPLAPIRSALHLMRTRERGTEDLISRQAREIIERQAANLTKIVSDLLEVSRVINGRIRLDLHVVDLNKVVLQAIETARPLIELHKHRLLLNLCPDPVWVTADALRLEEVFVNLLNNAAKYTTDGGRIEVWSEHLKGANYAQVRIRDNGLGIDAKLLPRIFDLFTQADRSLARSAGGLGIGLSLAHRIMEIHGGTIHVDSPPEGASAGSEFAVRLGLVPAPDLPVAEAPQATAGGPADIKGIRVLVVDDNSDQVLMLTASLRERGYSVQAAYSGPNGLKTAQQWRPDIVLLDIGLPGLDGYEVAKRIRSGPELDLRKARLIALSGYGRDTDIALARESGFDAHLTKPFDFSELVKLMVLPARRR